MMAAKKIVVSWSSGKDSALSLHRLLKSKEYEVVGLLSTVLERQRVVGMHGVHVDLLAEQAASIGLPLHVVDFPEDDGDGQTYAQRVRGLLVQLQQSGVEGVAFGDIFLEELRRRRTANLAQLGLDAVFPLWKQPCRLLAAEFFAAGFRSVITCVDTRALPADCVGRDYSPAFVEALPPHVDVCGENGEFHSFAYAGPVFRRPLAYAVAAAQLNYEHFFTATLFEVHNTCFTSSPQYGLPNPWPPVSGDVGSKLLSFAGSWVDSSGNGAGLLYSMTVPMAGGNSSQTFPVLHVWGTPYQQGYAQGVLLAAQIRAFLPAAWAYIESQPLEVLEKFTPAWFAQMVVNAGFDAALDFTYELQKDYTPAYVFEEMRGIADASGVPYSLIRRIMMLPDLTKGACSSIGLWGAATAAGNTLQMRALDWDMDGPFRDYSLVYVNHGDPSNASWGHPFVQASFVGFVGALTGQSAAGLAISEIGVSYPDASFGGHQPPQGLVPLPGVPFIFMLREILQSDYTIDDAANRMINHRRTCDLILSVGDGKLGYYRDFQYSPFVLNELDPLNYQPVDPTYHPFVANDVQYRYMDWPCTGGNLVLANQLTKYNGNWTADLAIANLASIVGTGDNHIAWYDLTNQIFYVSFAAPFASAGPPNGYDRQFTAFTLSNLFAINPPLVNSTFQS